MRVRRRQRAPLRGFAIALAAAVSAGCAPAVAGVAFALGVGLAVQEDVRALPDRPHTGAIPPSAVEFGAPLPGGSEWYLARYGPAARKTALAWFRAGKKMPHDLFAITKRRDGEYVFVSPADVDWRDTVDWSR